MCSLNDVLLSLLLLYTYFCDQIVMGPFDCEHNLLATARERSNKHCLLEKRSIDEQVTMFTRGHCASGDSEWALPTRIGIAGKRSCYPQCQCSRLFIHGWAGGKVRWPPAPPVLSRAWDTGLLDHNDER